MVDVLAKRYGWTKHYISEELYWEEMFEMLVIASNFSVEERNAEFKLHFMLHADEKAAKSWKDMDLPFPSQDTKRTLKDSFEDSTGVRQLQALAPHIPVHHLPQSKANKEKKQ